MYWMGLEKYRTVNQPFFPSCLTSGKEKDPEIKIPKLADHIASEEVLRAEVLHLQSTLGMGLGVIEMGTENECAVRMEMLCGAGWM